MKRLRVYLSSTFEDLKEYRVATFAALDKAGLEVARMESYTAADERPLDLCLRDVAQSEIYVGLYAWRYGYEPPVEHGNPQAKSITELEYRQAESRKLHKLLFFAHPDTKADWPDPFKDEVTGDGERGEKLARFRKELRTEKSASFFRNPDELATLVLAAIMRSALTGRPYNVPPLPPWLVPRPNLTNAIVESLLGAGGGAHGASTLVQGAGGFGKTTLAIDACHRPEVINAFPDGMLWVTLGEKSDLAKKLLDLHVVASGSPPAVAGVDEIGKALAKTLEGRRCLVVVDDVWHAEDLLPFLALDGPQLLVTTRIRTLIEQTAQTGWPEVPVDEMEESEATALLGRGLALEDPTREALQELANRLGCWPLLLALVNARLIEEQKTRRGNVSECMERVTTLFERRGVLGFDRRDSNARNAAVARSVDVGLELADQMFPGLARRASEISVFSENVAIPAHVLADLWQTEELDVEEEALRPLDDLSLLRWDREAGVVRLHSMIRSALHARLAEPDAVHRKLIDAWGDPCRLPHDYAWRWFGWHCVHANQPLRLQRLLLDFDWLRAKLEATEINSLVAEFDRVPRNPKADSLQGALRLSTYVLARKKSSLAAQLLARIPEHESELRDRTLRWALAVRGPWLRPMRPSLALAGGPLLRTLVGHAEAVLAVALTPDGKCAVSASWDGILKVWDVERGEALHTFVGHERSWDDTPKVALTPDGQRAVSASADGTLKIWDRERGQSLRRLETHQRRIMALALTPDGQRAASASTDGTLKIWDLERGEVLRTLEGLGNRVSAVALTPDCQRAVWASWDRTLKIWDLERGEVLRTLVGHAEPVLAVALTPDGKCAVSAADGTLTIWDCERGQSLRRLETHQRRIMALALTPDGQRAASASTDGTLKIWDLERGEALRILEGWPASRAVALTSDARRAVSTSVSGNLKVWALEGGVAPRMLDKHQSAVSIVAFTPNGQRVVSASVDGTIKIWNVERAEALLTLEGHAYDADVLEKNIVPVFLRRVEDLALTPDGRRAVSASHVAALGIWDLERGGVQRTLKGQGHERTIRAVKLTPDGQRAVSASADGTLKIWDLERGEVLRTLEGHAERLTAVELTPDGQRAVSASVDGTLKIWDLERGEVLRTLEGHAKDVVAVKLTPDGQRAVSASADGILKVWDVERGEALHTLVGHAEPVLAVALTPDGKCAVSASRDRTVAVWDLEDGQIMATFDVDSVAGSVSVAPDGRTMVVGDEEGRVHFLRLENAP